MKEVFLQSNVTCIISATHMLRKTHPTKIDRENLRVIYTGPVMLLTRKCLLRSQGEHLARIVLCQCLNERPRMRSAGASDTHDDTQPRLHSEMWMNDRGGTRPNMAIRESKKNGRAILKTLKKHIAIKEIKKERKWSI